MPGTEAHEPHLLGERVLELQVALLLGERHHLLEALGIGERRLRRGGPGLPSRRPAMVPSPAPAARPAAWQEQARAGPACWASREARPPLPRCCRRGGASDRRASADRRHRQAAPEPCRRRRAAWLRTSPPHGLSAASARRGRAPAWRGAWRDRRRLPARPRSPQGRTLPAALTRVTA